MSTRRIQERLETLTARMDHTARKSSADPIIQERLTAEVDELWREVRKLEKSLR